MRPTLAACASLISRLTDQPADAEETIFRTLAVMGPLMVLQRARQTSLRALDWLDFDGDRLVRIKAVMWRQAQAMMSQAGPGDFTPPPLAGGGRGRGQCRHPGPLPLAPSRKGRGSNNYIS